MSFELKSSDATGIKAVDWLWDRRVPRGNLTVLVGEEGFGKSTFLCWLAARLSRGELPGDSLGQSVNTLFLTAEDGWEDTINPRLQAAGADRARVFELPMATAAGQEQGVRLPEDVGDLLEAVKEYDIGLLIADPINAYLGGAIDSHKDTGIRAALGPVMKAAADGDFAVLAVLHINKGSDRTERAAMMGSAGYRNAARSTLVFGLDPDRPDKDGPHRVIVHGDKHNLARRQPGFQIEITEKLVEATGGGQIWTPCHEMVGETWVSSQQVLEASVDKRVRKTDAVDEAVAFLEAELAGGPRPTSEVNEAAKDCGISKDALSKARDRLDVQAAKIGFQGKWQLSLPKAWAATKDLLGEAV